MNTITTQRRYRITEVAGMILKDAPVTVDSKSVDHPDAAAALWREVIEPSPRYTPGVENFAVLLLNTRRKLISFQIVSTGTLDTILVHPREVFRAAILQNASGIVLMHNHPSGDPSPSEADVKVTRDLIRAGQLLKIEVLDHVIIGESRSSLRELGYFYT
jgi:DNA repair protein RadC